MSATARRMLSQVQPIATSSRSTVASVIPRLRVRAFKDRRSEAALIREAVRRFLGIED